MKTTLQINGNDLNVSASAGAVIVNGSELKPHEALVLSDRLRECVEQAEQKANALRTACTSQARAARDYEGASLVIGLAG